MAGGGAGRGVPHCSPQPSLSPAGQDVEPGAARADVRQSHLTPGARQRGRGPRHPLGLGALQAGGAAGPAGPGRLVLLLLQTATQPPGLAARPSPLAHRAHPAAQQSTHMVGNRILELTNHISDF